MPDHEDGVNATAQESESMMKRASSNGSEPAGHADAIDPGASTNIDDGNTFLADLAKAMQTTAAADHTRSAEGTERRRKAHIDAIRAREAREAQELADLAKEDVKGIDAWAEDEAKRIKLERERRTAARREQLEIRLQEHKTVIGREVEAVEAAIASYSLQIEDYFGRLESEIDPVAIARHASSRPPFPDLEQIGKADAPASTTEFRHIPVAAAAAETTGDGAGVESTAHAGTGAGGAEAAGGPEVGSATSETAPAESKDAAKAADAPVEAPRAGVGAGAGVAAPAAGIAASGASPAPSGAPTEAPQKPGLDAVAAAKPADAEPVNRGATAQAATAPSTAAPPPGPVAASEESKVVMPKAAGVGSWLRWPNSSNDKTDNRR